MILMTVWQVKFLNLQMTTKFTDLNRDLFFQLEEGGRRGPIFKTS